MAWRRRGMALSHRDWVAADRARIRLRQQWHELFREWDVVLCPSMPTPAFAHDHSTERDKRVIGSNRSGSRNRNHAAACAF